MTTNDPMIEPATFRFAAQHLNHCATAVGPLIIQDTPQNFVISILNLVPFYLLDRKLLSLLAM
jgi:hypothetical protein